MHLRISQDFERIYAHGQRAGDDHLLIFATANDLQVARLGLSVSRKHGSAVHRNLKRRRIREELRSDCGASTTRRFDDAGFPKFAPNADQEAGKTNYGGSKRQQRRTLPYDDSGTSQ